MRRKIKISFLCIVAPYSLFANPEGFHVTSGVATLSHPDPSTLTIHTGERTIIRWDQFSIAHGETTRFVMPSAASAVLNRVIGGNLSEIYGALEANGKVFLINPKGIIFGENAQINTASFFASTLDALDADFLKGGEIGFTGDSKSSIVNLGTISAWDGDVALIAYHIDNQGVLNAKNGVAGLAAGTNVLLVPEGNQRILIRACSLESSGEGTGIDNSGVISALQAELKADGNPYQFAIKESGTIDALAIEQRGGHIYLVAEGGRVDASGTHTATHSNGSGGEVQLLGKELYVRDSAQIDVSGSHGGGTVLIGGDYQGNNPEISNAEVTYVAEKAQIRADAASDGNGGKVILWGDRGTGFFGTISARGGEVGGDGGFVEVSSPQYLDFAGKVDTSAPQGKTGLLLLDPCTVTISTAMSTPGVACNAWTFGSNSSANIQNSALNTCLVSNDVIINASGSGDPLELVGSITVNAPITWSSTHSLTLQATDPGSVIQINDQVSMTNTSISTPTNIVSIRGGNLIIGDVAQTHTNACSISTLSGNININVVDLELYGGGIGGSAVIQSTASVGSSSGALSIAASGNVKVIGRAAPAVISSATGVFTMNVGGSVEITGGGTGDRQLLDTEPSLILITLM